MRHRRRGHKPTTSLAAFSLVGSMRELGREAVMSPFAALPVREVPALMQETHNLHLTCGHLVEKPVRVNNQFSQSRVSDLRHHATTFTQFRQARGGLQHSD